MPDVQEVFRMSTQKMRQDPGAMERQHTRQRRAERHRKLGSFVVAGGIVAAVVLVATVMASEERATPTRSVAAEPGGAGQTMTIVNLVSGAESTFTAPPGASAFDFSRDSSSVTYVDLDENEDAQLFVMDADGANARQITHGVGDARNPSWSPDGSMIAYERDASSISQVFIVRVSSGESRKVTREPLGGVDPGWTPDGDSLVYSTPNGERSHYTARILDLSTGQTTLIVADASSPRLSPDGARIAFNSWLKPRVRLIVANSDGSDRQIVARTTRSAGDAGQIWSPDSARIAFLDIDEQGRTGTYVYDVSADEVTFVTDGIAEAWIDDDHLLVSGRPSV